MVHPSLLLSAVLVLSSILPDPAWAQDPADPSVRMWEAPLTMPTYLVGRPDPNPRFYAGRAYQGAQGRVYPYPMRDALTDRCVGKTYRAVYLENEFVKVCILPELGGRVFSALDRTNGYDLIYRQHVVKPALIGLLGAWTSGGIEWNFPHHHRATSFLPVEVTLRENPDGGKTVWVGEIERRHRMKWIAGVTLHPGSSRIETTVKLFNRTPFVHSFLWWANVAVHANPDYQVVFPPATEFATYHAKNQFVHWPVGREVYKGVDYSRGVDLSWWRNHPSPISFFAWNFADDFLAGYDHGKRAGLVHVADHHRVPGKKFWVWGTGPRGRIWDKILTDTDGPYLELMTGAYSDNQPDYSWLQPFEAKVFRQCWYPLREIGAVKQANLAAAVNLEVQDGRIRVAFNTTSRHEGAAARVRMGQEVLLEEKIRIGPDRPYLKEIPMPAGAKEADLRVELRDAAGKELVAYTPVLKRGAAMPEAVKPPPPPGDIRTVEELYLAGVRLEQFHSPALDPMPYYEEALKRDPGHSGTNTALGIRLCKQGRFREAEKRLRLALDRVTRNFTRPRDGEAWYYLGLVLKLQGKNHAAAEALGKAAWSHAFQAAANHLLAEIDCTRGDFPAAVVHVHRSLAANAWNTPALNLKAAILRRLGRIEESETVAAEVLALDPLNLHGGVEYHLERAVSYGNAGLWPEAIQVLSRLVTGDDKKHPMLHYYLGYFHERDGNPDKAAGCYRLAKTLPPAYCFPYRLESVAVLEAAIRADPADPRAPYYLGNLLFERQPREAVKWWERARSLKDDFATVHRNLGLAYARVENDVNKAVASLEKAVACDSRDPRLHYELDVLLEAAGAPPAKRLARLQEHREVITGHNDTFSRMIRLLTHVRFYGEAITFLDNNHFRKWEGVGNIHETWVDAHLLRGLERLEAGQTRKAVWDFEEALQYPENLEVARPHHGGRECQVHYFLACALRASGRADRAKAFFDKAAAARPRGEASTLHYYRARALQETGRGDEARRIFTGLIRVAEKRLAMQEAGGAADYFAKFGRRRSVKSRKARIRHLMGLGYLGLGEKAKAHAEFKKALALDVNHLWAKAYLAGVK